jgi:uncharacterized membrane protein HdeD (DUF308 family)
MEENINSQENVVKIDNNQNNTTQETEEKKPSIFLIIIGILLIVRGFMRLNEGSLGALGIIMIVIGALNIIYYISKRV